MNTNLTLLTAVCCGLTSAASAFTLDFIGQEGTTLPSDVLAINITGHGNVEFGAISPAADYAQNNSSELTPINVDFNTAGVSAGESLSASEVGNFPTNVFVIPASDSSEKDADEFQISFEQVPEPSTSFLGLIGCIMLVFRRYK